MDKVSCVYMIKHKLDTECEKIYIGSTCDFRKRIIQHKSICYNEKRANYNYKVYKYIRANGDWDNFEFIILEDCEVEKLKRLEQSYIDVIKPSLNMCNANGFDMKQYHKGYYQNNTEKINEYNKEYRENNKEKINEKSKEYYEKNKDKLKEKIECECGGRFTRSVKARHIKSKKHQKYLSSI
jgi:group I intron endonuclease